MIKRWYNAHFQCSLVVQELFANTWHAIIAGADQVSLSADQTVSKQFEKDDISIGAVCLQCAPFDWCAAALPHSRLAQVPLIRIKPSSELKLWIHLIALSLQCIVTQCHRSGYHIKQILESIFESTTDASWTIVKPTGSPSLPFPCGSVKLPLSYSRLIASLVTASSGNLPTKHPTTVTCNILGHTFWNQFRLHSFPSSRKHVNAIFAFDLDWDFLVSYPERDIFFPVICVDFQKYKKFH